MKRTTTLAALTLTSTLALAACGNDTGGDNGDSTTGTATDTATSAPATTDEGDTATETTTTGTGGEISAEHNDADVMFAQMMIPHHQQAVEMSEILLAKDNIPTEVADFAQGVIDAQGPEIDRMNAMLEAWGEQPVTGSSGMGGMDHGEMGGMSGMMTEEDLAALENAQGTEAARLYLEQMTAHHEGAVDMARDEVNDGQNPQAVALAEQVIEDQEAEIAEMEQMLQNL
ncbi:DUF305 domain-containing protein [Corynebacterium halotolerans]|uniref:DUF305 domain-containing protein n=1 Tax=Corynebacterium halotolerans YIM 70093 = DSM 44683 TaxID=1121362 RepID=M1MWR6_9CORY|nr:DUF305 domain-containing protein [Corynebacterium halotolerans]AGF72189.1 hypothetical protein A605_05915 [Corynebacterium halotolerans YIM 70093 = DSM 44683]